MGLVIEWPTGDNDTLHTGTGRCGGAVPPRARHAWRANAPSRLEPVDLGGLVDVDCAAAATSRSTVFHRRCSSSARRRSESRLARNSVSDAWDTDLAHTAEVR